MDNYLFIDEAAGKGVLSRSLSTMPGGYLIYRADESEKILFVNDALLEIFECESEDEFLELTGGSFKGMVHPNDLNMMESDIHDQMVVNPPFSHVTYRIVTRNKNVKYVENFGRLYSDDVLGPVFYVLIVTESEKYDLLTGLLSMTSFLEHTGFLRNDMVSQGKTPAMIAFNLNGLRTFNSEYGIPTGNHMLYSFGLIIRRIFGRKNCSRFGEDHFFAFTSTDGLEDKLEEVFRETGELNSGKSMTVRAGIFVYDDPEMDYSDVACDRARIARDYYGKTNESGFNYFDKSMLKEFKIRSFVIRNIDRALSEEHIKVYYQPQVLTSSGRICGFEALARWEDPEKGLIPASDFIPVLEDYCLTYRLDIYMLRHIAEDMVRLKEIGIEPLPISFNLSRTDFLKCDPYSELVKVVEQYKLPRSLFKVEITESTVMSEPERIRTIIDCFRSSGFEVYMDDFGSAYSSLSTLRDFEFDEIKIDLGFMKNFGSRSKAIIKPMIMMAKGLGIHTMMEGVETRAQYDFLKEIGCEYIQGFFFGKPESLEEMMRFGEAVNPNHEPVGDLYAEIPEGPSEEERHGSEKEYIIGPDYEDGDRIISAVASIYNSLHVVDLERDAYTEIRASYALHKFLGAKGRVSEIFPEIMKTLCSPEHIQRLLAFVDTRTLPDRLGSRNYIEMEFRGAINGWTNASFFVLDRNEDDRVTKVLFGTRVIDKSKKTEIGFRNVIHALSGVYFAMVNVDLSNGELSPLLLPGEVEEKIGMGEQHYEFAKNLFIDNYVTEDYRKQLSYFMEFTTLADRLGDSRFISMDYIGAGKMWRRVIFTASQVDENGVVQHVLLAIEDTDAEKNRQTVLEYQVEHDALTGLLNRSAYEKYTSLFKGTEIPLAFILLDINKFKQINDTYGHNVGDIVLRDLAHSLTANFGASDLIMRIGGDEFCVLLSGYDMRNRDTLLEAVGNVNESMNTATEDRPATSVSAGIAFSAAGFGEDIYKQADTALYKAKETEGGCVVVFEQSVSDWAAGFDEWVDDKPCY